MRTTLTLDDELAEELTRVAHETHQPFKTVVNETLRRGLAGRSQTVALFDYTAHDGNLLPGIDPRRLNELTWEAEEQHRKG